MGQSRLHPVGFLQQALIRSSAYVLAFAVGFQPLAAHGDTQTQTGTSTSTNTQANQWQMPAATNNQAGAQTNVGNKNSLASTLGTAMGVLSMAAGGLYMWKGAQDMRCCINEAAPDCAANRDGELAAGQKAANDAKAAGMGKEISGGGGGGNAPEGHHRQPVDYRGLRFPNSARNFSPKTPRTFLLSTLFRAPEARASGCLQATISLATGGLMLLSGIMGLAGAKQAASNADQAFGNAGAMGSYPADLSGTSPTGGHGNDTAASKLGDGSSKGSSIKLDPALLRTGTANDIMGAFEKKFGVSRDGFAQNVLNGEDPRKILATAPSNALSVSDMNKAITAAQNMSDDQKKEALSRTPLAQAQEEMVAKLDGAGTGGSLRSPSSGDGYGKLEDLVQLPGASKSTGTDASAALALSPEVQAALAERQAQENKVDIDAMNLFQRIHYRYQERTRMILGFDPRGPLKGVGGADGN